MSNWWGAHTSSPCSSSRPGSLCTTSQCMCLYLAAANCDAPPEGDGVEYTITDSLFATSSDGGLVVSPDAVATYSCTVEGYVIEDANELTCVAMDGTAQWNPAEAPMCEQGK